MHVHYTVGRWIGHPVCEPQSANHSLTPPLSLVLCSQGKLVNGDVFDSSLERKDPIVFE